MLRLIILSGFLITGLTTLASHNHASQLSLKHVNAFNYRIVLDNYWVASSFAPDKDIKVYERASGQLINTFTIPLYSDSIVNDIICRHPAVIFQKHVYLDTIFLDPIIYNHPSGYLFVHEDCCFGTIFNIVNATSQSSITMTLFPPVVDTLGNFNSNSTPILNNPVGEMAISFRPYSQNFGGVDPDGDSLVHRLTNIYESMPPGPGNADSLFFPFSNPASMFSTVTWSSGRSYDNPVPPLTDPVDRMVCDPITGQISFRSVGTGSYLWGMVTEEHRNGQIIGATYRYSIVSMIGPSSTIANTAPNINYPQLSSGAYWDFDTITINSAMPYCLQIKVGDPDIYSNIVLEVTQDDYPDSALSLTPGAGYFQLPDKFNSQLCFNLDSPLNKATKFTIKATNPGCDNPKYDSVSYYFKVNQSTSALEEKESEIRVYPNPTIGRVNIVYRDKYLGKRFKVYNHVGEIILEKEISKSLEMINLDSPGLYFIQTEGENDIQKIIKY